MPLLKCPLSKSGIRPINPVSFFSILFAAQTERETDMILWNSSKDADLVGLNFKLCSLSKSYRNTISIGIYVNKKDKRNWKQNTTSDCFAKLQEVTEFQREVVSFLESMKNRYYCENFRSLEITFNNPQGRIFFHYWSMSVSIHQHHLLIQQSTVKNRKLKEERRCKYWNSDVDY